MTGDTYRSNGATLAPVVTNTTPEVRKFCILFVLTLRDTFLNTIRRCFIRIDNSGVSVKQKEGGGEVLEGGDHALWYFHKRLNERD